MRRFRLVVVLLAAALPLLAQPDIPDGKWWKRPRVAQEIGLKEEQSRQIEEIFVKTRPKLIDLRADLEKKQFDLQQAMEGGNADRREVEKKIDAVEAARGGLQKARALMILDMKRVLKPEQWNRLKEIHQENRERRRMMREEGRAPRPNAHRPNRKPASY